MSMPNYIPCLNSTRLSSIDEIVTNYFHNGFTYCEILGFLLTQHGIRISLSSLKRILRRLGLKRRCGTDENRAEVEDVIANEIQESGAVMGYRKLWQVVKSYGVNARRSTVMEIIRELDPEGVASRKNRRLRRRKYSVPGPDHMWHLDGYDKLKPFGFSIHGCVDGFSRRVIWLEVGPTNKKPEVIANYYLHAITKLNRLPTRMRSDHGTENCIVEAIQIALRSAHNDEFSGLGSFMTGSSTSNQRIESFWSQFTKDRPSWWRSAFQELLNLGLIDGGNFLITESARYCFMHLIRNDLNELAIRWNQHILAPSKKSDLPRGRPDTLYFVPVLYNCHPCHKNVDMSEVEEFQDPEFAILQADNQPEFIEFAETVLRFNNFDRLKPETFREGLKMHITLLTAIEEYS